MQTARECLDLESNNVKFCKEYETRESRIKLFKSICDYHAKGNFKTTSSEQKEIVNNLFLYSSLENGKYDITKGLYLHGSVGSGKSTLIAIVRDMSKTLFPKNTLSNVRIKRPEERSIISDISDFEGGFRIVNSTDVANSYRDQKDGDNALKTFQSNNEVCFDEFGREPMPVKNFGTSLNVMQFIIEVRYDNWVKNKSFVDRLNNRTHFTTNIFTGDSDKPNISQLCDIYQPHVADRLREMCNIIHVDNISFRGI